jgi:hypothetical protein
MKKKPTARKTGAKKTGRKNTPKKTSRRKRPAPKRVIADRKDTVLSRLKNAFEETATKIKTLMPGEAETAAKQPDERTPDVKR